MSLHLPHLIPTPDAEKEARVARIHVVSGPSRVISVIHVTLIAWFGGVIGSAGCAALAIPPFFMFAIPVGAALGFVGGLPVGIVVATLTLRFHFPMTNPERFRRMVQWIAQGIVVIVIGTCGVAIVTSAVQAHDSSQDLLLLFVWFVWAMMSCLSFGKFVATNTANSYLKRWTFALDDIPFDAQGVIHADGGWYG